MQFERNRMYRVKAVAESLDVSVATIYRAIESGALDALKIGTGKGTLRIPGQSVNTYVGTCAHAVYTAHVMEGQPVTDADTDLTKVDAMAELGARTTANVRSEKGEVA
jgi:excisionase family DNA binding protein